MVRLPLWPGLFAALSALTASSASAQDERGARPNVVLFFTDDQGYGDLSCQGHPTLHTPNIDRLAADGIKLTQFYVASPVCSPSRAALLTGCYPKRVSMHRHVIFPDYDYGLHTDEVTIADALRARGYATGCFGKWHLGHRPGLLPLDQGFDEFEGVPYSNDMAQFHRKAGAKYRYRLPWMRGREVVEWEPDQHLLTERTTRAVLAFIDRHRDRPFFAYVPYSMPHIPIYASPPFAGRSPRGLYGDVIEEIDASVGRVLARLEARGLSDDTIVLFASDNGPWLPFKENGGDAGPLRGGKGSNWEGGQRVPCIVRWPGHVPAGAVCREAVTAMDVLPTVCAITGAALPARPIDGHDVRAHWFAQPGARSPNEHFLYYTTRGALAGVRCGPWKLLLGEDAAHDRLFQVEHDIREDWDVAAEHPKLAAKLRAIAQKLDDEITAGMRPTRRVGERVFDPVRPGG